MTESHLRVLKCDRCGAEDQGTSGFAGWSTFRTLDACPSCTEALAQCWAQLAGAKALPPLPSAAPVAHVKPGTTIHPVITEDTPEVDGTPLPAAFKIEGLGS